MNGIDTLQKHKMDVFLLLFGAWENISFLGISFFPSFIGIKLTYKIM